MPEFFFDKFNQTLLTVLKSIWQTHNRKNSWMKLQFFIFRSFNESNSISHGTRKVRPPERIVCDIAYSIASFSRYVREDPEMIHDEKRKTSSTFCSFRILRIRKNFILLSALDQSFSLQKYRYLRRSCYSCVKWICMKHSIVWDICNHNIFCWQNVSLVYHILSRKGKEDPLIRVTIQGEYLTCEYIVIVIPCIERIN